MKKLIALLLAALLVASLAACGQSETKEPQSAGQPAEDTAENNGSEKIYTVACSADFPPYEYFENEKIVGAEVDVMNAIAEKLGIQVTYEDMDFESIIPAIESKKFDIGMSAETRKTSM